MSGDLAATHEGRCTCGHIQYKVHGAPMFVHCCHCRWCQRETGSAFALNAFVEADRVELIKGQPEAFVVPSPSGHGQTHWRCPECRITVWSNYNRLGPAVKFIRIGTLLDPDAMPPDIHIFTSSKQPWVVLNDGNPQVPEFYDRPAYWPKDSLDRLKAATGK